MKRKLSLICTITFSLLVSPLFGQDNNRVACLKMVQQEIALDQAIRVTLIDRSTIQGRMLEADTIRAILKMYKLSGEYLTPIAIGADSIAVINYRKAWQFKPQYVAFGIGGAVVGAIVGQVIEGWIDPGGGGWKYREDGRWFGGLAGFAAGMILPMAIPSGVNINCK
ncbi:exported hypothetical protein [Candidatus Zixiibacteriota bacterium]|nr:exported hypothetical protein [candidate division Zixibacteria bacterium]